MTCVLASACSTTPRPTAGLLRIRRVDWRQWAGSLGLAGWSLTSAATRQRGSKGEGNSQEAIVCTRPSLGAFATYMGQPPTDTSKVGPSLRAPSSFRSKEARPTQNSPCGSAGLSHIPGCIGAQCWGLAWARTQGGGPVNKSIC